MHALLIGLTVALSGTLPWVALAAVILRSPHSPPWEVPAMALYLVVFWRYLNGWGWPKSTTTCRRESLRARSLSSEAWTSAMAARVLVVATVRPKCGKENIAFLAYSHHKKGVSLPTLKRMTCNHCFHEYQQSIQEMVLRLET